MLRGSECRVLAPGDALADEGAGGCDNARLLQPGDTADEGAGAGDNNARLFVLGVHGGTAAAVQIQPLAAPRPAMPELMPRNPPVVCPGNRSTR